MYCNVNSLHQCRQRAGDGPAVRCVVRCLLLATVPVGATASRPRCWPLPPVRAGAILSASVTPPAMPQPIAGGACPVAIPSAESPLPRSCRMPQPSARGACPVAIRRRWVARSVGVAHATHCTPGRMPPMPPSTPCAPCCVRPGAAIPARRVVGQPPCCMPQPTARFAPQRPTCG